jgi:nitroreductase
MDVFETIKVRRSVRSFAARPVEENLLQSIIEAAMLAPSAGNCQAYELYVARQWSHRRALARAAWGQDFLTSAPTALVFCAHPARSAKRYGDRGASLYALQDATIACAFAMLAAAALGLATVWVGAFDPEAVRRAVRAPESLLPVAVLPVGYPAESPEPTTRRPFADIVHEVEP